MIDVWKVPLERVCDHHNSLVLLRSLDYFLVAQVGLICYAVHHFSDLAWGRTSLAWGELRTEHSSLG